MVENLINEHPMTSLVVLLVLALGLVVAVVNVPIYYAMDYSCGKKAEMLNSEHHFGYFEGCWIKQPDNTWVEYTTIRNVEVK